jgi:2-dehydro-3-deoxy-D-arabinonate dehydratase
MTMRLIRATSGVVLDADGVFHALADDWNSLINHADLLGYLRTVSSRSDGNARIDGHMLAPIGSQEVWAAGVTYYRSRTARIEESKSAGGGSFYDRVYEAERPELFFKAAPWRVRGPNETIRIRRDAKWSVPEPELALCINARAEIVGYTIGNDMSSRDIEGENPLYLPQAKTYDGSCALGPSMLVADGSLSSEATITIEIRREGTIAFEGATTLAQMRRTPTELVEFLYRETSFPSGCVLLTGTGVVPPDDFTLQSGDDVRIEIGPIGVLENQVE